MNRFRRFLPAVLIACVAMALVATPCIAQMDDAAAVTSQETSRLIQLTTEQGVKITLFGKAFLLERPDLPYYPPILHVQGTPYEMGYQHGVLLADRIQELVGGVGSPMMFMLGGWNPESGEAPTSMQLQIGRTLCLMTAQKCFIGPLEQKTPDYLEEIQGLADGLQAVGSPVGFDEMLVGIVMAELSQSRTLALKMAKELASMNSPGDTPSGECSDFAAWGAATVDGKLIHGTNYDNEDFTIARNGIVLIAKPQSGNAFLGMISPGFPWPMRGMSVAGITVGEPTSVSSDDDILAHPQVGHCAHMRRVLQYANNTQDAIEIMRELGGSTGWNIFTTDGNVPTAVDIQVSCTKTAVIRPMEGVNALWSTNQYTAYPGYQGYPQDAPNLVKDQMQYWGVPWEDVDTIDKWQAWLKTHKANEPGDTWARYERLRELLKENYGLITTKKVIAFMSDPILSQADERLPLSGPVAHLYGIERPVVSQKMASTFSAVFVPADSMAYIAMGAEPAQAGTYWPISLRKHLALMDSLTEKAADDQGAETIKRIFEQWAEKVGPSEE